MSFIKIWDAIEQGIIPQEGIIGSVWMEDDIYGKDWTINAGCWFQQWAGLVIENTSLKCWALTEQWTCSLSSDNIDTSTPCKVLGILENFYKSKKEAA